MNSLQADGSQMTIDRHGFLSDELSSWRELIRQKHAKYFALVERVNAFCQETKYNLSVHSKDGQQVLAAGLMLKILNDAQAAVLLIERGLISQARSLLRVAAEGVINLANMTESEDFYRSFIMAAEKARLSLLRAIQDRPEPHFDDARKHITPELVKDLANQIKEANVSHAKIKQLAENVNLSHLYVMPYKLFSPHVHSGPLALEKYIKTGQDGELEEFVWGPDAESDPKAELLEVCRIMVMAIGYINRLFDLKIETQLSTFKTEVEALGKEAVLEMPPEEGQTED